MDGDLQNDPLDIPDMLKLVQGRRLGPSSLASASTGRTGPCCEKSRAASPTGSSATSAASIYATTVAPSRSFAPRSPKTWASTASCIASFPYLPASKVRALRRFPYATTPAQFGVSKYGLGRTFKVVSDLMLMLFFKKYMQKPMHLFAQAGLFLFSIGALINVYLLVLKIMGQDVWGRPLLILGAILLLAGIQLITVGIIVEVLMRTYYESQNKRPYRIREVKRGSSVVGSR